MGDMNRAEAEVEAEKKVYEAISNFFEYLEAKGLIAGNGHHMAQYIAGQAKRLVSARWREKSPEKPDIPVPQPSPAPKTFSERLIGILRDIIPESESSWSNGEDWNGHEYCKFCGGAGDSWIPQGSYSQGMAATFRHTADCPGVRAREAFADLKVMEEFTKGLR